MSADIGIGSVDDIESIRTSLAGISGVNGVEAKVKDGGKTQYVEYTLHLGDAAGDDIRIHEIKETQIPLLMDSKSEDSWFDTAAERTYSDGGEQTAIVFCTGGLNPDPEGNPGVGY